MTAESAVTRSPNGTARRGRLSHPILSGWPSVNLTIPFTDRETLGYFPARGMRASQIGRFSKGIVDIGLVSGAIPPISSIHISLRSRLQQSATRDPISRSGGVSVRIHTRHLHTLPSHSSIIAKSTQSHFFTIIHFSIAFVPY